MNTSGFILNHRRWRTGPALEHDFNLKPKTRIPDLYQPQSNTKVFGQAGFIYLTPENDNYNPKRDYSLSVLKDACRKFPLQEWEEWSTELKDIVMK
jgi:hypothetical protein